MTQLPILVAAANLAKSPSNVRTVGDPVADAQLEANIAVKGVRQNLIGVPVSRKKGHYRIIAGGRRLDAVHRQLCVPLHLVQQTAEHHMTIQPERDQAGVIRVLLPTVAGEGFDQRTQRIGQAIALHQGKRVGGRRIGHRPKLVPGGDPVNSTNSNTTVALISTLRCES